MPEAKPVESFRDLHFPLVGIDRSRAYDQQAVRQTSAGQYAYTTPDGVNVRSYGVGNDRARGGSRAGLVKWIEKIAGAERWIVQDVISVVASGITPPGGNAVQTSQSGRVITVIAVSQGDVWIANPGDTAWTPAVNESGEDPPLNFSGLVRSAVNIQRVWFADGVNYVYYDPANNTVWPWLPTAGDLPVDDQHNTPRLICTWRGRTVVSGLFGDPANWFMSKVGDPTDFEYFPPSPSGFDAVAGNNANLGLVGDIITALVPYSDDVMMFGCDHSIWMLRGDPLAGGQLDLVTDAIGFAWGQAWCRDPYGVVYFFSNRMGIYTIVPGSQPMRISQGIENLLAGINTGDNGIRLVWDDRFQGLHVFITPLDASASTTHFFYETRSGAWWKDRFANSDHNPLVCCALDGNEPDDRVVLIGSWDGYVRRLDPAATTDDGYPIRSEVVLGPMLTKDFDEVLLLDIQGVLGAASGRVNYSVYVGATAEIALATQPVKSGVFSSGRNLTSLIRRSGHAVYVKLSSIEQWAMEAIRARVATQGKIRRRGY